MKNEFNQIKYQNEYNKEKYDRMSIMLPKGKRAIIKNRANNLSLSVNAYINRIVDNDISSSIPLSSFSINNRRYLGNKYKLTGFIKDTIEKENIKFNTITDIFAGTGAVASAFPDKDVITNDILYSNYISHIAWFGNEDYDESKIDNLLRYYNSMDVSEDNYMSQNFSNTFFCESDCKKIGFIRENIENLKSSNAINSREYALLITSLIYAMDKIAQTCGHYDAYRKNAEYGEHLELKKPLASHNNRNNQCYNEDAYVLAKRLKHDLVYMDPPYNSRQYGDAYHLLENVAKWEKPEVFGVARKMDRSSLKSDYCTTKATEAFERLINQIAANYIILSYNNMGKKGNGRSNAKMNDDDIMRILSNKGQTKVFSLDYKVFTTGKSDRKDNQERLFVCKVKQ